jgi:hypothetical protein
LPHDGMIIHQQDADRHKVCFPSSPRSPFATVHGLALVGSTLTRSCRGTRLAAERLFSGNKVTVKVTW